MARDVLCWQREHQLNLKGFIDQQGVAHSVLHTPQKITPFFLSKGSNVHDRTHIPKTNLQQNISPGLTHPQRFIVLYRQIAELQYELNPNEEFIESENGWGWKGV